MYCIDQQYKWEDFLALVEFAYNKSYHSSIGMTQFKILYGHKCRTLVSWDQVEDKVLVGLELLNEMEE